MPAHDFAGLGQLPLFAVLGRRLRRCSRWSSAKGLFAVEDGFRRLPVGEFWHPVIGALGFALVGLLVPRALGVGYDAISDVLDGRLAVGVLAVLPVAKLLAWWVALGSGTSGGTLAPILLISGALRQPVRPRRRARRPRRSASRPAPSRWWRWPPRSAPPTRAHVHRDRLPLRAHPRLQRRSCR